MLTFVHFNLKQLEVFTFETLETTEIVVTEVVPLFYTGPRALYILLIISISLFIVPYVYS